MSKPVYQPEQLTALQIDHNSLQARIGKEGNSIHVDREGHVMSKQQQTGGYVGIDVSKATLDISLRRDGVRTQLRQQENTPAGIKAVVAQMKKISPTLVVFEPSGGYEKALAQGLGGAQIPFALANARKARDFARSGAYEAKTDKVDAAMLAHYGEAHKPAVYALASAKQQALAALRTRRTQVMQDLVAEKNRRGLTHPCVQKYVRNSIETLENQIKDVDEDIQALVRDDPEWAKKQTLMTQVTSIGVVTAAALLAEMPELGTVGRKTIGRLAGLAPMPDDSGQHKSRRRISGGRPEVRTALYMATMNATQHNPVIAAFYTKMIKAGKLPKVALTACMRKLLVTLNAILKSGQPWEDRSAASA